MKRASKISEKELADSVQTVLPSQKDTTFLVCCVGAIISSTKYTTRGHVSSVARRSVRDRHGREEQRVHTTRNDS